MLTLREKIVGRKGKEEQPSAVFECCPPLFSFDGEANGFLPPTFLRAGAKEIR